MRRFVLLALLAACIFQLAGTDLRACGDKLLLVGRGARYQLFHPNRQPLTILIYNSPALAKNSGVHGSALQTALTKVGYKLTEVSDMKQFADKMGSGKFDLILADPADLPSLRESIQTAPSKPKLVPVVFPSSKVKESQYVALVDDAAKVKSK